jgi:hypothetical protein
MMSGGGMGECMSAEVASDSCSLEGEEEQHEEGRALPESRWSRPSWTLLAV